MTMTMHDLIHDLVQYISQNGHNNFAHGLDSARTNTELEDGGPRSLMLTTGHGFHPAFERANFGHLRALVVHRYQGYDKLFTQSSPLATSLLSSSHLRWLAIEEDVLEYSYLQRVCNLYNLCELKLNLSKVMTLESIGNLKHLRKLELVADTVNILPEPIFLLPKLKSLCLNIRDGGELNDIFPKGVSNLTSLQELFVRDYTLGDCFPFSFCFPVEIGRLTNLQQLGVVFRVGCSSEEAGLSELRDLVYLKGKLSIDRLGDVFRSEDAKAANLINKKNIEDLELRFTVRECKESEEDDDDICRQSRDKEVLENMMPHSDLRSLGIACYRGNSLPYWLTEDPPYLTQLKELALRGCMLLTSFCLPKINALEYLDVEFCQNLEIIDLATNHSLINLRLSNCPLLRNIHFDTGASPTTLKLFDCPSDVSFPPSLKCHEIYNCPLLELPSDYALSRCTHRKDCDMP